VLADDCLVTIRRSGQADYVQAAANEGSTGEDTGSEEVTETTSEATNESSQTNGDNSSSGS